MLRLFAMVLFLMLFGWVLLSAFSPDLAGDLMTYIFGLLAAIAILKLIIDCALHFKKIRVDKEAGQKIQPEDKVEVYDNIDEFRRATNRLSQKNDSRR